ncbi:HTH-type transcriptional activator AllS [Serratia quinivorans]|uniref:LysR family transcriptional regulator n=1 Tax=Serratia quinivorans TaxID=137545 RepID=UPI0021789FF8|nr:LysR family transcriptional regulator [Serratia quinivorans]CAI1525322.1 HTH-type transcriptional activator AllS [Serratia quinivorans]
MRAPKTTLDQWHTLQAVIEQGGYIQAAEYLHRSQSSVSYSLHTLQERLGVKLLMIVGRKAELTVEGRALLEHAKPLITAFTQLEARASAFALGEKVALTLVADSVFPKPLLFRALRQFQQRYPQTQVRLREILRGESRELLAQGDADLYITTLPPDASVDGSFLMDVNFIAVAHRQHPLHQLHGPLTQAELVRFHRVVITDPLQQADADAAWSFTTFDAAIQAICHGVGYGWLPQDRITGLLASGELQPLPLAGQRIRATPLYLIYGNPQGYFDLTTRAMAEMITDAVQPGEQLANGPKF